MSAGLTLVAGCGSKTSTADWEEEKKRLSPSGDSETKIMALSEIATRGSEGAKAVNDMIQLLRDEDPVVRRTAAYALGTIGPAAKAAVPTLKEMLQTTDKDQLTAAGNALQAIDPAAIPGLKIENVSN